jgi:Fe-S cluster assembly ATP-binding protein
MRLTLENFSVWAGNKKILSNVSFSVQEGIHLFLGANGSGKSTLFRAIMKAPHYKIEGKIKYNGQDLTKKTTEEMAKIGFFLAFQQPPEIKGLSWGKFLSNLPNFNIKKTKNLIQELNLPPEFLHRDLNVGFSGGEKKRSEILQMELLNPKVALLDEIDSGVDIGSLPKLANTINSMKKSKIILIVSHSPELIKNLHLESTFIINNGEIIEKGKKELALKKIEEMIK